MASSVLSVIVCMSAIAQSGTESASFFFYPADGALFQMAFYINKRSDPRIDFSNLAPSVGYKIKQVGLRALIEYSRSRFIGQNHATLF